MARKASSSSGATKTTSSASAMEDGKKSAAAPRKQNMFKRAWKSLDLDFPTIIIMAKGALPPAIALALLKVDAFAQRFTTISYLVAIAAVLGMAVMPRAKFIQTMVVSVLFTCIGAAIMLLVMFCSVQARLHTEGPPPPNGPPTYNPSASAVSGIWLFFLAWGVNYLRAKFPQFNLPSILVSILSFVGASNAPLFTSMTQSTAFLKRILEAFLSGFAIATLVSLFIFPITSRTVVSKEIVDYTEALSKALRAESEYFESLEDGNMFVSTKVSEKKKKDRKKSRGEVATAEDQMSDKIETVKKTTEALTEMHGKLHGDLSFAKREVAWGHLGPEDLSKVFKLLRAIMLPTICLNAVSDIFKRVGENGLFKDFEGISETFNGAEKAKHVEEWHDIMRFLNPSIREIVQAMDDGLQHSMLVLKFKPTPKKQKKADEEAKGPAVRPGDEFFGSHMKTRIDKFYKGKELALRAWCDHKGVELPVDFFEHPTTAAYHESEEHKNESGARHQRNQRQLYLILFMEYLLHGASKAILELAEFAEEKKSDGTMAKKRLIVPGARRTKKWIKSIFKADDGTQEEDLRGDMNGSNRQVSLGSAYGKKKDPEHLPPANAFEKAADYLRAVPRVMRSSESAFGFRAACASMSIAILAFLSSTQHFFTEQRVVWALIMVAISMTPTAGQSIINFALRIVGTAIAAAACYAIYYIPVGNFAGIIVLLWLWVAINFYLPIKKPEFAILGIITILTAVLVIGYELEVQAIGEDVVTSSGQRYYPIYLLAPYRLGTVVWGLAVAFVWTLIPYPISEHSVLRQQMGASLYLLANFYSIAHETVKSRIRGDDGDSKDKNSPAAKMQKARNAVYAKQTLLISGLRENSTYQRFEIPFGGKFPKEHYDTIIQSIANIHNLISLVEFASDTFSKENANQDEAANEWFNGFKRVMQGVKVTTHQITSLLALLSSSISSGQPLPPYLTVPQPYQISKRLEEVDRDILSVRHISEPGYAAFAVIQISTRCIIDDLDKLLSHIKDLVGELDFSFHVVSTEDESRAASTVTLRPTTGQRDKAD